MFVLVTYDVKTESLGGKRRLRRIAKLCQDYGQRVQFSVFECEAEPAKWEQLKSGLLAIYKPDQDSLRFYYLGSNWQSRVEHHGTKVAIDFHGPLIV